MYGVPDRTRTCDPQFRKLLLYPTELRGRDGRQDTLPVCVSPAALCSLWLELRWAEKDTTSDKVPDHLGLNVSADCTTMDLPEKRLDHRERPQRRTVVALTRLMLTEQHPYRRHVEEARIVEHGPAKRFAQTPVQRAAEPGSERYSKALFGAV